MDRLWKYHPVLTSSLKRQMEDQELAEKKKKPESSPMLLCCTYLLKVILVSFSKGWKEFESIQWRLTSRIRNTEQLPYEESSKPADSSMKRRQPRGRAWEWMNGRQRTSDKLMVIYYSFSTPELGENKQDDQTEGSQHTEGKTLLCNL